jgi:hypothetical protein
VRRGTDAYNRGDLGAFLESFDEDVVLRAAEGWPETAYHGKRAARSFYEGLVETVGGEAVIEELIDAGEIVFHPRTPTCEG